MSHRSILQDLNGHTCYLCLGVGYVEAHHVFHGTGRRRLAEQDGMIVNLCPECHHLLHDKGLNDDRLKAEAERYWLRFYGKGTEEFIARYGKSYI